MHNVLLQIFLNPSFFCDFTMMKKTYVSKPVSYQSYKESWSLVRIFCWLFNDLQYLNQQSRDPDFSLLKSYLYTEEEENLSYPVGYYSTMSLGVCVCVCMSKIHLNPVEIIALPPGYTNA